MFAVQVKSVYYTATIVVEESACGTINIQLKIVVQIRMRTAKKRTKMEHKMDKVMMNVGSLIEKE